jgi:hypothetical protein
MDTVKEIEISKELSTAIGFDIDTLAVVFNMSYEGKHGYSKLENGVKLISILEEVTAKTENKWDDATVALIKTLIEKLGK